MTYSSSKNTIILGEFYDKITNSMMHTYPKSSTKPAYTIRFSCLGALADWLKKMDETAFNGYFIFMPAKNTSSIQVKRPKSDYERRDLMWAKSHFANLRMDENKRYNRDEVVDILINCGYGEDFKMVPMIYWKNVFKTTALMKPETIFVKLSQLRPFFEAITLDSRDSNMTKDKGDEPKNE